MNLNATVKLLSILFTFSILACADTSNESSHAWIEQEIKEYLSNTDNLVKSLHDTSLTEQLWAFEENIRIDDKECIMYSIILSAKSDNELGGRIIASTQLAFDTINKHVFEINTETGEFDKR